MPRKKPENPNPVGRPRKKIDKENFERLCALQCTKAEVAAFFDCGKATIDRFCQATYGTNFENVFAEKRQVGFISLRRAQFRIAERNAVMAIFLGKNYLGQSDVQQIKADVTTAAENPFDKLDVKTLEELAKDGADTTEE